MLIPVRAGGHLGLRRLGALPCAAQFAPNRNAPVLQRVHNVTKSTQISRPATHRNVLEFVSSGGLIALRRALLGDKRLQYVSII